MFQGHDPYLVALSVGIAILGGYTGFGLAARIRDATDAGRRAMLAGAACFLAIGIWTMHFVGMLAAPLPADAGYLVLPTLVSFLICALVVGISLLLVSVGKQTPLRVAGSAVLLGAGIASMHYVGMHGLSGHFGLAHDPWIVALSVLIAIGAAYGGLQVFIARPGGWPLAVSAVAFGIAVSGMHYMAMYGMRIVPASEGMHHHLEGMVASQQILSLIVALLCFIIAAGFLLSLMPDASSKPAATASVSVGFPQSYQFADPSPTRPPNPFERTAPAPLAGLGQPQPALASRIPVEGPDGTHFLRTDDIRSFRADAHYTRVYDGVRERMCLWSISEAEAQLNPDRFLRVHRSHIVAIPHITTVRKEGDGAVIELAGESPQIIPISRARIAEVKARLGLARRSA